MARVKNGAVTKARHKKVLKAAKGYFGSKHRLSEIENKRREISENYGLQESMQLVVKMTLATQGLLKV